MVGKARLVMVGKKRVPERVVERMSVYRRTLENLSSRGNPHIYSHELAGLCGLTAAQVRRDLMMIGFSGNSAKGYEITRLTDSIAEFMGIQTTRNMLLVGIGHLGRALLDFFADRCPHLNLVAAFDVKPQRVNRVVHGVRCYPMGDLSRIVKEQEITLGMIAVPAEVAQDTAWILADAGLNGILNFAPVQLRAPKNVHADNLDITTALEKVAFFAR